MELTTIHFMNKLKLICIAVQALKRNIWATRDRYSSLYEIFPFYPEIIF